MPSHRRSLPAVVLLACCLLALLALAPLAVPSGADKSNAKSDPPTYDDPETRRLLAEGAAREERRVQERRTPEARERRAASRTRFRGLGGRGAADLAVDRFAGLFDGPDGELLELKTGQRVVRWVGDNGAVVDNGKRNSLVTSTLPMRVRDESGDLRPVDLGLEPSGDGFEPRNPVAAMRIDRDPGRALVVDGVFALGDPGVASGEGFRVDNNVFYGDVATDTDMWLTPRPEGAELSYQLRSAESPETLTVDFDLPRGTKLEETADGSVDVMRDGKPVASIAAPVAWDASKEPVPASQRVAGDRIVIDAAHRDRDVEYPIAVDPLIWTYNLRDWDMWPPHNYVFEQSGGADFSNYFSTNQNVSFWGRGFYLRRRSNVWYPSGSWGQYVFRAFRASFVQKMRYIGVTHRGPSTHITTGIWGGNNYQNWENRNTWSHNFDNWTSYDYWGGVERNMGVFSIGAPNGGSVALRSGAPYYEGSAFIAGAESWESDYNNPWIHKYHDETPGGWVHSAQPLLGFDSGDPGLGVRQIEITAPGHATDNRWTWCPGTPNHRCPDWHGTQWYRYNTDLMPEGHQWVNARSEDIINNWSGYIGSQVHIDRSAPSNSPSGDLVNRDGQLLTGDSYGMTASSTDRWSGVAEVRVDVNGATQPSGGGSCGSENCTINRPFTFVPPREGLNTITTKARDHLNHWSGDRHIRVISDRQKPTASVTHSGLPADWVESANVETTVSSTDSGGGVKRAVVAWPGGQNARSFPNAATCSGSVNDRCPGSGSVPVPYGSADLQDGINTITGTAVDAAQRSSDGQTWQIKLDRGAPEVATSGTLYDQRDQEVADGVYTVHADGTDGSLDSEATARSGVVHMELRLDGQVQEEREVPCATHSCALELDWAVDTTTLRGGSHLVEVTARDRLGHEQTESFTFTKACCLSLPTQSPWTAGEPQFGDVDGDALDDAVGRDAFGRLHVALSNGDGFDAATTWGQGPLTGDFAVADANADGNEDVLWAEPTGQLRVALSGGASFAAAADWGTASLTADVRFADVDADGQADAVEHEETSGIVSVAYSEGTGFEPAFVWTTWDTTYDLALADVTGDGGADAIGRNAAGDVRVGVSDAGSFGAAASWGTVTGGELRLGDVNGDGMDDAVALDPATGEVTYGASDGDSFGTAKALGTWSADTFDIAEVHGDDAYDLVGHDAATGQIVAAASNAPTPPGLPADSAPAVTDVDVEEDMFDGEPAETVSTQSTQSVSAAAVPKNKPRLAVQEDRVLLHRENITDEQIAGVYRRLREAGVSLIRFNAYWGGIENRAGTYTNPADRYEWESLDAAVEAARDNGMKVHITFTGIGSNRKRQGSNECTIVHPNNPNGLGCHPGPDPNTVGPRDPTGHRVDGDGDGATAMRTAFGEFVEEGVRRYTRDDLDEPDVDAYSFGIWNEPNHAGWLWEGNSTTRVPSRTYRLLYAQGYGGWQRAIAAVESEDPLVDRDRVKGTQILIGELSSGARSGRGPDRPGCTDDTRGQKKCFWTAMDFLEAVAGSSTSPLRTSGLAYHPYQARNHPDDNTPIAYKQDGSYEQGPSLELGIGRLGAVERALHRLCAPSRTTRRCTGGLRAPTSDKRPGLYLTEFGYYNQPTAEGDLTTTGKARKRRNRYWHTEHYKASWFAGKEGALTQAARSDAKWMLLYHAVEAAPNPKCRRLGPDPADESQPCDRRENGVHEYGLFDLQRPGQQGWTPGDDIYGIRPYGKDDEWRPKTFRHPQRRKTYCAIRRWAIEEGYLHTKGSAFPAALKNRCPTPSYAHDDD